MLERCWHIVFFWFDNYIWYINFWRYQIIEDFQKLTVSLRGNLELKTNIIVFNFKGQLDAFSEKQFKSFVSNNLKNEFPFVIDLTKIDFLDSSGLGALVQTAKECKKLKLGFSVVGNSRVAQTIKLVRLGDFLYLKSSLEDALNYLDSWVIGFKIWFHMDLPRI